MHPAKFKVVNKMHRKGFKANPLRNEGDMKVFYCVAAGEWEIEVHPPGKKIKFEPTPSGIARALKTKPSTAFEHLEKLTEVGFVKPGARKGKSRLYEVNWKRVIDKFWELSGIHEYLVPKWEIKEVEEKAKAVLNELKNSKLIQEMIKDYFKNTLPDNLFELGPSQTLLFFEAPSFYDAVREFEGEVARYKFEEMKVEDKEVHKLLKKWQDYLTRVHSPTGAGARDAMLNAVKFKEEYAKEF